MSQSHSIRTCGLVDCTVMVATSPSGTVMTMRLSPSTCTLYTFFSCRSRVFWKLEGGFGGLAMGIEMAFSCTEEAFCLRSLSRRVVGLSSSSAIASSITPPRGSFYSLD